MIKEHRQKPEEWDSFAERLHACLSCATLESQRGCISLRLASGMGEHAKGVTWAGAEVPDGHLPHLQLGTKALINRKRHQRIEELREREEARIERKRPAPTHSEPPDPGDLLSHHWVEVHGKNEGARLQGRQGPGHPEAGPPARRAANVEVHPAPIRRE
jgi:hypothetical protein